MTPTVVSYFTPTWDYPEHAERLAGECRALGVPYHIREAPDQGSYLANTRMKPAFLRATLRWLDRPLLWVDVDGSVLKVPDLGADVDFMARPLGGENTTGRTWHVGTLLLNPTPGARRLLWMWQAACRSGGGSDEQALETAWTQWDGTWAELPPEYFDVLRGGKAPEPDTVIAHRLSNSPSKRRHHKRPA